MVKMNKAIGQVGDIVTMPSLSWQIDRASLNGTYKVVSFNSDTNEYLLQNIEDAQKKIILDRYNYGFLTGKKIPVKYGVAYKYSEYQPDAYEDPLFFDQEDGYQVNFPFWYVGYGNNNTHVVQARMTKKGRFCFPVMPSDWDINYDDDEYWE